MGLQKILILLTDIDILCITW